MSNNSVQTKIYHINTDAENINKNPVSKSFTKKPNSLSGLLAHYNSDSETEDNLENDKLDNKVDSFLQEINNIALTETIQKTPITTKWQECFDESTGYPYYWNVETNQVTWEIPLEYSNYLKNSSKQQTKPVQPPIIKTAESIKKTVESVPEKISNVQNTSQIINNSKEEIKNSNKPDLKKEERNKNEIVKHIKSSKQIKPVQRKKSSSESEDEKIVMITSYSEDTSESETENNDKPKDVNATVIEKNSLKVLGPHLEDIPKEVKETPPQIQEEKKKEIIECYKEDVDETVILARIRTQARVLQELDGELPESVDRLLNNLEKNTEVTPSLLLVAGYGDDSENEDEQEQSKSLFPIPDSKTDLPITAESTLFPITKPIDINQFTVPEEKTIVKDIVEPVDSKIFKRKRRIGIAYDVLPIKQEKKVKTNEESLPDEERVGFGFKLDADSNSNETKYSNFKKGGIAFVKSDILEPPIVENIKSEGNDVKKENLKDIKEIVTEKVNFLCEGKREVSAVQIMLIRLQMLEEAFKAGGLDEKYFFGWLRETDRELAKLEKDAAPDGWLCQWDRSNKRYFYRNEVSGETQWNYPEQDIVGGQEAMDICTTPPPEIPHDVEVPVKEPEPPPPPVIGARSPSPPPPPVITTQEKKGDCQPPLPPLPVITEPTPPPPPPPLISADQPLPPGVDQIEQPYLSVKINDSNKKSTKSKETKNDSFGSELDSFYSDIAMIEASTSNSNDTKIQENVQKPVELTEKPTEVLPKKKKKTKSKLTQGSTMKKKAVSSLVEKWKKVQNDYM